MTLTPSEIEQGKRLAEAATPHFSRFLGYARGKVHVSGPAEDVDAIRPFIDWVGDGKNVRALLATVESQAGEIAELEMLLRAAGVEPPDRSRRAK